MPQTKNNFDRAELVEAARLARERAYAPYSEYHVGAALVASDGTIFSGCNVENAAYPATICAERVALTKAVSEGHQAFTAIAVVTANAGTPCGVCRQMLFEFSPEMIVIVADERRVAGEYKLSELLPHGFGPHHLK